MLRVLLCVFLKGNKTCKRGDKRSRATDIDAKEQLSVIFGKLGQKDCRGDVAYNLAGKGREN